MKHLALTAAAAILAGVASAAPEDATPTPAPILSTEISGADLGFFIGAPPRMTLLARLSELARKRAVTPEVRDLATAVWNDETGAAAALESVAASKHVRLSGDLGSRDAELLVGLAKLKGPKFDKSYLDALGDAQTQFETSLDAAATSSDRDIKAFADATLATLKQERDRVRKLGL